MLPIAIDRNSQRSMAAQIQSAIRERIKDGILHPGVRLPSSRNLAGDLGVSRSVVVQAYEQLIAEGFLQAGQGAGTRVSTHLPQSRNGRGSAEPAGQSVPRYDLRADATNSVFFPSREWLKAYEHVGRSIGGPGPRQHDALGAPELRAELAAYLGRSRGVLASGSEVAVATDVNHAIGVVCRVVRRVLGIDGLAVEDPGAPGQVVAAKRAGLQITGIPVDGEGIDVKALERSGLRAVLVTPVSQVPSGAVMSPRRRETLLRWAVDVDGWVIEDDRAGHTWFGAGSGPLALQRHCPERVFYIGTTGIVLGPCVQLGWAVAPETVTDRLGRAQLGIPDPLTQMTFAYFIASGMLDQQVRQVRGILRKRRSALRDAVEEYLPGSWLSGAPAGIHAYLRLRGGVDDARLAAAAQARSILVHPGRHFRLDRRSAATGVVLGYGAVRSGQLGDAVKLLASSIGQVTGLPAS